MLRFNEALFLLLKQSKATAAAARDRTVSVQSKDLCAAFYAAAKLNQVKLDVSRLVAIANTKKKTITGKSRLLKKDECETIKSVSYCMIQ